MLLWQQLCCEFIEQNWWGISIPVSALLCVEPHFTPLKPLLKPPFLWHDFYCSIVIAQELTGLLWLFQRSRGLRRLKRERKYQLQKDFVAHGTCSCCLPWVQCALARTGGCVTEETLPGPFSWHIPDHRHGPTSEERSSRGTCDSWPSWQGNSLLAAGTAVLSLPLPQLYGKSPSQPGLNPDFSPPCKIEDPDIGFFGVFLD